MTHTVQSIFRFKRISRWPVDFGVQPLVRRLPDRHPSCPGRKYSFRNCFGRKQHGSMDQPEDGSRQSGPHQRSDTRCTRNQLHVELLLGNFWFTALPFKISTTLQVSKNVFFDKNKKYEKSLSKFFKLIINGLTLACIRFSCINIFHSSP